MEDLIAKVLSGEASDLQKRRLEAWRAESPDHERMYGEMQRVWEVTSMPPDPLAVPPPSRADIVAEAERRRTKVVSLAEWRVRRVRRWQVVAVAAAAAVLLIVGLPRLQRQPAPSFSTAAGERRTVTLADGSVVRLGPESMLEVREASSRAIRLQGQAFFAVATDSARPFTVETPVGRTQVLGTRFEIASSADSLRVLVVEGRVAVAAAGTRVDVAKGEVTRVTARSAPTDPVAVDVWALLEWPDGLLIFQATPLVDVLQQLERHFAVPITIRNGDLARRTVTAWFDDEPLLDVVGTVCAVVGARCEVGDTVTVAP